METQSLKVLLVEDNPGDVRLLREIFREVTSTQFRLTQVERLTQALKCLDDEPFDVVLLDLSLPDSQGLATFVKIHSLSPAVPIVVLTGLGDETLALKAVQLGAEDYLFKGQVNGELLVRSLRYAIERQQTKAALYESEARLHLALEAAHTGIWDWNLLTNKVTWSNNNEQLFGEASGTFDGTDRAFLEGIHPQDREFVAQSVAFAVESGAEYEIEFRIIGSDGNIHWMAGKGQVFCDQNGKALRMIGVNMDITDRKQSEQKIREQAALLDVATDAIVVQDLNNHILFWNKGAERLYGWSAESAVGKNANELLYKALQQLEDVQETVAQKGEWQGELTQVQKSGEAIVVQSRWTLVRDDEGKPKSILVVNTDITEKKQLEAQFLRAQRLDSIGTLASGMAHDLNNILTPILTASQLLQLKLPNADTRLQQLLQTLETNAKRGASLVKQVLSFARGVEGDPCGTGKALRQNLQVGHLISEIQQIALQTFPKSIEFYTDIPPNLWTVSGDVTQLHQVLMNLVVNARDAMPNGGTLRISAENFFVDQNYARTNLEASVGAYIVITVMDTGTGIPPEIVDRIFEPFFTTKEVGKGTGLGLSTVIGIIKSHGGFVNVYSDVGSGTRFKVYLPSSAGTQTEQNQNLGLLKPGYGELILVVDDEAPVREITKTSLLTYNYRVLTASDGVEAIALYAEHQEEISAVLIDMMMPSLDGRTTIRTLQKINPQLKIIAISGLPSSDKVAATMKTGVKAFLSKPYTVKELLNTINGVLTTP